VQIGMIGRMERRIRRRTMGRYKEFFGGVSSLL